MPSVAVNSPKTPVTKGSNSVAAATVPNVCKMPGPPAPFVPTPLPNIGRSNLSPQGYSTSVKIEGEPVAIQGASFNSIGDIASKGTGGGIVSNNCEGPTKFIGPGSLDVKIEGKNVQYLGDPMMNNCGPTGSPPNAATMMGVVHAPLPVPPWDLDPPGTCTDEQYKPLRQDVKDAKAEVGKLGGCSAGDSPALLKKKGNAWMKQGVARAKLDNTCFGGGNEGHQAAQATCWDHVGRCQGMGR
jgi:uncharacterized Zn-binding protein involved in type VI secretion